MDCLADKTTRKYQSTARSRVKIFLIFFIILSSLGGLQPSNAQEQWRVFTTANSPLPSNFISRNVIDCNNIKWIGTDNEW
jgi:hypothetical protein